MQAIKVIKSRISEFLFIFFTLRQGKGCLGGSVRWAQVKTSGFIHGLESCMGLPAISVALGLLCPSPTCASTFPLSQKKNWKKRESNRKISRNLLYLSLSTSLKICFLESTWVAQLVTSPTLDFSWNGEPAWEFSLSASIRPQPSAEDCVRSLKIIILKWKYPF